VQLASGVGPVQSGFVFFVPMPPRSPPVGINAGEVPLGPLPAVPCGRDGFLLSESDPPLALHAAISIAPKPDIRNVSPAFTRMTHLQLDEP
jgi:hypothetical protein